MNAGRSVQGSPISKIKEVLEILEDRIIEIKISEGKGIVCG